LDCPLFYSKEALKMEVNPEKMSRMELMQYSIRLSHLRTQLERRKIEWQAFTRACAALAREYSIENPELASWCTKQTFKSVNHEKEIVVETNGVMFRQDCVEKLIRSGDTLETLRGEADGR
jgi:hypothetical protein